jgi:hypothetical protein
MNFCQRLLLLRVTYLSMLGVGSFVFLLGCKSRNFENSGLNSEDLEGIPPSEPVPLGPITLKFKDNEKIGYEIVLEDNTWVPRSESGLDEDSNRLKLTLQPGFLNQRAIYNSKHSTSFGRDSADIRPAGTIDWLWKDPKRRTTGELLVVTEANHKGEIFFDIEDPNCRWPSDMGRFFMICLYADLPALQPEIVPPVATKSGKPFPPPLASARRFRISLGWDIHNDLWTMNSMKLLARGEFDYARNLNQSFKIVSQRVLGPDTPGSTTQQAFPTPGRLGGGLSHMATALS